MNKIKILVVDDHMLVRDGITALLSDVPNFEIVALASSGRESISLLNSVSPDIILMDVMMPEMNGIETAKKIVSCHQDVKIILLSMEINEQFVIKGIKAGVKGYLPKDIRKKELTDAIRKVFNGGSYFSNKVSELLLAHVSDPKPTSPHPYDSPLSRREIEVLEQIASGLTNRAIAEMLHISVKTVDTHRNNILQKLEVKSTADIVKYAIRNNIITLD